MENLRPAQGGVDGETLDQAKVRGPLLLRARSRAVTAEDYEALAREAAPEVARVRCMPAGDGGRGRRRGAGTGGAGGGRVSDGRVAFENLLPAGATCWRIAARLDEDGWSAPG